MTVHARAHTRRRRSTRLTRALALALVALGLASGSRAQAGENSATERSRAGRPERCYHLTFRFPPGASGSIRREFFKVALLEWLATCVEDHQAPEMILEAQDSLDLVFKQLASLSGMQAFTIIAEYTTLEYFTAGELHEDVKSVSFQPGGMLSSDLNPDIALSSGPSSDLVKQAATAARKALQDPAVQGSVDLGPLLSVLEELETHGQDLDDTWFNLLPASTSESRLSACFKDYSADRGSFCRPNDEALKLCERHLGRQLAEAYHYNRLPPRQYAEVLLAYARNIQAGVDEMAMNPIETWVGQSPCPSIKDAFIPRLDDLRRRRSLYRAGGY